MNVTTGRMGLVVGLLLGPCNGATVVYIGLKEEEDGAGDAIRTRDFNLGNNGVGPRIQKGACRPPVRFLWVFANCFALLSCSLKLL